jgi:hypothetical protein
MNCKHIFDNQFFSDNCDSTFISTSLKDHRKLLLLEIEKTFLPATQRFIFIAKEIKNTDEAIKNNHDEIKKQTELLKPLMRGGTLDRFDKINKINIYIQELKENENQFLIYLQKLQRNEIGEPGNSVTRKCPIKDCKGFLNNEWICGTCESHICEKCNEHIGGSTHICKDEYVESMKLINKDTKPCPTCGTMIHKYEGCSQMWCVVCHTTFDYNTLAIDLDVIHSPHYYEYLRKKNSTGDIPRNPGDYFIVPMQQLLGVLRLQQIHITHDAYYFLNVFHRLVVHVRANEITTNIIHTERTNRASRILYMTNEITEKQFKTKILATFKKQEQSIKFNKIYEEFVDKGRNIIRQVVEQNNLEYTNSSVVEIKKVVKDLNETLKEFCAKERIRICPGIDCYMNFRKNNKNIKE